MFRSWMVLILLTAYCLVPTIATAQGQAGTDIAVLKAGFMRAKETTGGLTLFETKENKIARNKNQDQSRNKQVDIYFHNSPAPLVNKIKNYQEHTTNYGGKEISIGNIPFDHEFTSFAKVNEKTKNATDITNEKTKLDRKLKIFWGRRKAGEITPAENQATEILPRMSDAFSNWPIDNFMKVMLS